MYFIPSDIRSRGTLATYYVRIQHTYDVSYVTKTIQDTRDVNATPLYERYVRGCMSLLVRRG